MNFRLNLLTKAKVKRGKRASVSIILFFDLILLAITGIVAVFDDLIGEKSLDMRMIDRNKYDDHIDNKASHCAANKVDVINEGSMDEKSGMTFSEYVAILSGNTDLFGQGASGKESSKNHDNAVQIIQDLMSGKLNPKDMSGSPQERLREAKEVMGDRLVIASVGSHSKGFKL
jgi:hypothetical protein